MFLTFSRTITRSVNPAGPRHQQTGKNLRVQSNELERFTQTDERYRFEQQINAL